MITGQRRLAIAVLEAAINDFRGWARVTKPRAETEPCSTTVQLALIRIRLEAGYFLLHREDPVTQFWFAAAEVPRDFPRRNHEWTRTLEALQAAERSLVGKRELAKSEAIVKRNLLRRVYVPVPPLDESVTDADLEQMRAEAHA